MRQLPPTRQVLLAARAARVQSALRTLKKGDPRALDPLRSAIRRLRDLLPVLQLQRSIVARADRGLRKIAVRLKPIARIDALLAVTREITVRARELRPGEVRVVQDLRRRRADLEASAAIDRVAKDLQRILTRLKAAAGEPGPIRESQSAARTRRWAVKARAARRAVELKRALADAGGVYVPGRLAALQRAVRRMSRAGALLSDVGVRVNPADLKTLTLAADALQRLRRSESLIGCVRRLQGGVTLADLQAWKELDELIAPLEYRCRQLHGQYVREREALDLAADRLGARAAAGTAAGRKVS